MATSPSFGPDPDTTTATGDSKAESTDARLAFRTALSRYQTARLLSIVGARGLNSDATRPTTLAADLTAQLDSPSAVAELLAGLSSGARQCLCLFALLETPVWRLAGLSHALATLGVEPRPVILDLLSRGLLVLEVAPGEPPIDDFFRRIEQGPFFALLLRVHPSVPHAVRTSRPEVDLTRVAGAVGQIREADGLEPIVRLGAIWQCVGIEPLRQTQQGSLYKRDSERIDDDPVLACAISDALEPLAALPRFWLQLALRLGLILPDASGERLVAAGPEFWVDNAVHLPQMIATGWLGLEDWSEVSAGLSEGDDTILPMHFLRSSLLLWLACLDLDEWVTLEELGNRLRATHLEWDRPGWHPDVEMTAQMARGSSNTRARNDAPDPRFARGERLLRCVLLGAGYWLGLVRAGQEKESGRIAVQLTPLGRYVLAIGPPPAPRQAATHFLFVQPNFEIIAYRQGLSAQLVGRLSRFARWTKVGAATELALSQESVVHGLEGGMTSGEMLELLTRHSQRPLPATVLDAVERWASRRERITFYAAATLIEFGTAAERDLALAQWQESDPKTFVPVAERFLLVENPKEVPNDRIRTSSSRDYRHPPEKCVSIEPDGITLTLDPARADLLIDAELGRIADEIPAIPARPRALAPGTPVRRFTVSADSMARAAAIGISRAQIVEWFQRRTGGPPSPAILLLIPDPSRPTVLRARRMLVLSTPYTDLADGLLQHPATCDLVGQRLGPAALSVPENRLDELVRALALLGYKLEID
jgi:hypothetical protein